KGAPSFTFQGRAPGGTANGGVILDRTRSPMTMGGDWVNNVSSANNNTVTTLEDHAYTFGAADFGFTDPNDAPPNALSAVEITTGSEERRVGKKRRDQGVAGH